MNQKITIYPIFYQIFPHPWNPPIIFVIVILSFMFYYPYSVLDVLIVFLFTLIVFIINFVVQYISADYWAGKIVIDDSSIKDYSISLFHLPFLTISYSLSAIRTWRIEEIQQDKTVIDVSRRNRIMTASFTLLFGRSMAIWWFTKRRKLILIGQKGETLGAIDLHGFDDAAVERLVFTIRRKTTGNTIGRREQP